MSRSESSPPSPSPKRKLQIGALALAALALVVTIAALWPTDSPPPAPPVPPQEPAEPVKAAEPPLPAEAETVKSLLGGSRSALGRGELRETEAVQKMAETLADDLASKYPNDQRLQDLVRQAREIVFQFEAHGSADPPAPGQTVDEAARYPDDPTAPGSNQVNDLFVAGWANQKRNQSEAAVDNFNRALDHLDKLLATGSDPAPAPATEGRHSEVALPPQTGGRSTEVHYLQKYYAITSCLADQETKAGHPDRAEAARRRALAAMDQALANGADVAAFHEDLDSLLRDLARAERLNGRLESARLTLQRRLGLIQYLASHPTAAPSPPTAPTSAAAQTPTPDPGKSLPTGHAKIFLELAWLDRHTFHYDEGLEYLAELLDTAERLGPAAFTEEDRRAKLIQGQMQMDLGRFPEAELALKTARSTLNRQQDEASPVGGSVDVEPRVTTIGANLALAELRLTQGDLAGARQFMEEALSLYNTLPGGHPVTFDVQLVRVKILARQGESAKAERELTGFLAGASGMLASPEVDIWVKRQILALRAESAWQAQARGETALAVEHYRRVNDELTPYITGIDVEKSSEYGSLFRPILVEIMEGEGDLRVDMRQMSQAESRYVLGLDMARALRDQEPRQYFWRSRFDSLAAKVERFHY